MLHFTRWKALAIVLVLVFATATATNALGVFSIFGGFLCGVAGSFNRDLVDAIKISIGDLVAVLFLPIFFVVGIARLLFIPLVLTIAISLFMSFFISRTVTPALCYKFVKPEHEALQSMPGWLARFMHWSRGRYEKLDGAYQDLLTWMLAPATGRPPGAVSRPCSSGTAMTAPVPSPRAASRPSRRSAKR